MESSIDGEASLISPESVGMSTARLSRLEGHLKRVYVDGGRFPGTHTMVYRKGKLVHSAVNGLADVERGVPLKHDAIYRIYSMTKPITSVAFMMLVEDGVVGLDEPVHRYIPSWRSMGVYRGGASTLGAPGVSGSRYITSPLQRPMRIVDLLRHTSGLTYGMQNRTLVDAAYRNLGIAETRGSGTLRSMVDTLSELPLEFSPGEAWNYSVSTDVLGYLIEQIADVPLPDFLQNRVFGPLGMVDTGFYVPQDSVSRLTACYAGGGRNTMLLQDDPLESDFRKPPSFYSGGSGLVSTASDYMKFCRALLNGGMLEGQRLISPKTLALMTQNHLPENRELRDMTVSMFSETTFDGVGFGLGFAVTLDPARSLLAGTKGEYWWSGVANTTFWIDPAEELIVLMMTQLLPSTLYPIRRELRSLVYSAITDSNV